MRAAVLKERSVNDSLGLNGPPNLEEWLLLVSTETDADLISWLSADYR